MITLADRIELARHIERWKRDRRPFIPRDEVSSLITDAEWMLEAVNHWAEVPTYDKAGRPRKRPA